MEVSILPWNLDSDRPIYAQLMEQIKLMIVTGVYPPGSKLPSVRDLAAEAAVNPNTMQRSLAQLEGDGLLYTQRTSGRFVTEDEAKIAEVKNDLAAGVVREFVTRMERLGYSRPQMAVQLSDILKEDEQNGQHL